MNFSVIENQGKRVLEILAGERITSKDYNELLSLCYFEHADGLLMPSANLEDSFFDISSGQAGEIMQKIANYDLKAAIVMETGTHTGKMFSSMASESNRQGSTRFFENRDAAIAWLFA